MRPGEPEVLSQGLYEQGMRGRVKGNGLAIDV
jgi:hypothetical protein